MIQIQDVSFEYEKEQGTLSHIDLNIQQGECVVLTGESGCGKTTVTKLINGLIPHFVEGGTLSGTTIVGHYVPDPGKKRKKCLSPAKLYTGDLISISKG